ncbi:MAG TPA: Rieske 2Fe-2S domain-containing protein [Gemmatimonadales bacterium]|nr:Rieske 2Fe-2S domain-containing protein [Gemmatimonadales bacterium]
MDRRRFAERSLKTAIVAAIASVIPGVLTLRGRSRSAATKGVEAGDRLVFALGQNAGQAITEGSFTQNEAVLAYPEGKSDNHENLVLVCKLDPAALKPPVDLAGTAHGVVAYSAICTHLGCTVRFSEEPMDQAPFPHIHCPCHGAMFDPQRGGVVLGGPPPRPLPQLPIKLNDKGEVLVAGAFSAPVGVKA